MEITPGVYGLAQEVHRDHGRMTIFPAAVETQRGLLLVDVGDPGEADQIEDNLDDVGSGWDDVWAVLLTHQDRDHAGTLRDVVDRTGAAVFAHEKAAPYVDGREQPIKYDGEPYPPVDVDVELVDGVSFRTRAGPMQVVFTPGHAPGHVALYFPDEAVLLAADALIAGRGSLHGPNETYTLDMDRALESAARLAELNVENVLCFHGGLVEASGADIRGVVESLR